MDTKVCNKCLMEHSLDNFYKKATKCKPCHKAYAIAWSKDNPDKVKASKKKLAPKVWQKQKQDKEYSLNKKLYRQKNRQKRLATAIEWNKKNKNKYSINVLNSQIKRKRLKNGKLFKILDKEFKRLYSSNCAFCGSKQNITIDHIIPLSRSGNHSIGNLQSLCKSCNSKKQSRFISEYKYLLAKLDY